MLNNLKLIGFLTNVSLIKPHQFPFDCFRTPAPFAQHFKPVRFFVRSDKDRSSKAVILLRSLSSYRGAASVVPVYA